MGEYLTLISDEGIQYKTNAQSIGSEKMKEVDRRLKSLIKSYFVSHPHVIESLYVSNGKVSTKLATCEEVFFTFEEMIRLNAFIVECKKFLVYAPEQEGNSTPIEILKDKHSLYLGTWKQDERKKDLVKVTKVKDLKHYEVWKKWKKVTSKTGKTYYRKYRGDECSGCFNNGNGKKFPCPNSGKQFKAYKVGFAYDHSTQKGRDLYTCPVCEVTFNQGEYATLRGEGI